MLALGRAETEMPATAACTDGAGAAETGVTSAVIPATLSTPTAEARPIHFLSRNKCPPSSLRPPCPRASQHGPRTTPHLLGMSQQSVTGMARRRPWVARCRARAAGL